MQGIGNIVNNDLIINRKVVGDLKTRLELSQQDRELALMQVTQLQEELEYYYKENQELHHENINKANTVHAGRVSLSCRALDFSSCGSCDVVGSYSVNGYSDIALRLNDVIVGDGRYINNINCKLVLKEGKVGIEFRENDISGFAIDWTSGEKDEHGSYKVIFPNTEAGGRLLNGDSDLRILSSERVLIYTVASTIADCFCSGVINNTIELSRDSINSWGLCAVELLKDVKESLSDITFNDVLLIEQLQAKNYEHLWVSLSGANFENSYFVDYEFKIGAKGFDSNDGLMAGNLQLEFRRLKSGVSPLQWWPEEGADEYGEKYTIELTREKDELMIDVKAGSTERDTRLIFSIVKSLPKIFKALKDKEVVLNNGWEGWNKWVDGFEVIKINTQSE